MGMTARATGNMEAALEAYRAALDIDQDLAEAHMNIASLLSAREDLPADAAWHYKRALALREWPDATAAHAEYNAALALHSLGGTSRIEAAIAALKRARKLNPGFEPAREMLADLARAGDAPEEEAAALAAVDATVGCTDAVADGEGGSSLARCGWRKPSGGSITSVSTDTSSARALHAAATALKRAARDALADPDWAEAARQLASEGARGGSSEAQLLSVLVADLGTLIGRLVDTSSRVGNQR